MYDGLADRSVCQIDHSSGLVCGKSIMEKQQQQPLTYNQPMLTVMNKHLGRVLSYAFWIENKSTSLLLSNLAFNLLSIPVSSTPVP